MQIARNIYLERLIKRRENGMAKIITGIRRCGKSYLLSNLYGSWLQAQGVPANHIINVELDDIENIALRDPLQLYKHVRDLSSQNAMYYVFLDEIQYVDNFADAINGLLHRSNLDVYVTGSNSKFLSTDILTEFRGRGDEIRVHPLSFSEYAPAHGGSLSEAWKDYFTFGGMPLILSRTGDEMKSDYLAALFEKVYMSDICDRNNIRHANELDLLVDTLASSAGSLTNPSKIAATFKSAGCTGISDKTVKRYLDYLSEAFLVERAKRYDIKGRKYITSTSKYYFEDVGLRNARLNFRQQEENHIMENIIFNELRVRGWLVDVGTVNVNEKTSEDKYLRKQLEIDFVATKGNKKCYIQSAFQIPTAEKAQQEKRSLEKVADSFKKIVVVKDDIKPWHDDNGILTMGLFDFLLDQKSLER